jgi:hypothetical protein
MEFEGIKITLPTEAPIEAALTLKQALCLIEKKLQVLIKNSKYSHHIFVPGYASRETLKTIKSVYSDAGWINVDCVNMHSLNNNFIRLDLYAPDFK